MSSIYHGLTGLRRRAPDAQCRKNATDAAAGVTFAAIAHRRAPR
jgi:hypothetical protein